MEDIQIGRRLVWFWRDPATQDVLWSVGNEGTDVQPNVVISCIFW